MLIAGKERKEMTTFLQTITEGTNCKKKKGVGGEG
jgi:hypothetical protein